MNNQASIHPDAITTSLERLSITHCEQSIGPPPDSGTTSASASFPPSCALSLASYHTPETSDDDDDDEANHVLPPPFTIRQTKSRGLALFATRRIPPGTLIFSETPLFCLSKRLENDCDAIEAACKSLTKPDRKVYLALYDTAKSRLSKLVSIYYSNCYNTDNFSDDGGSSISPLASRINHSCVPNAAFSYVPPSADYPKGQVRFHAIKGIPATKEITSCYEKNIFLTKEQRQRRLMLDYGFHCDCEACMPKNAFWETSDERRRAMAECVRMSKRYEQQWEDEVHTRPGSGEQGNPPLVCEMAIKNLLQLETLLTKEGLSSTPLANTCRRLAKWYQRIGSPKQEQQWKQKELDVCKVCFGEDAVRSNGMTRFFHSS